MADRVVSVLAYVCPDITYSPTIYPIAAILLHFMSGMCHVGHVLVCFCYLVEVFVCLVGLWLGKVPTAISSHQTIALGRTINRRTR